jgi:hypothetical protein
MTRISAIIGVLLLAISAAAGAKTWYVKPDGSGDAPTIQAAIDSAATGDIVMLASGTFSGIGNRGVDFRGKGITVRSELGVPQLCIIDCDLIPHEFRRGFSFHTSEDAQSVLTGVTIRRAGSSWSPGMGGGVNCDHTSPTITNCIFLDCSSEWGAGIYCQGGSPTIVNCIFAGNIAHEGGGIACDGSGAVIDGCIFYGNSCGSAGGAICIGNGAQPKISNCTMCGNGAVVGGGMLCYGNALPIIENVIIAFSTEGGAINCWPTGCDLTITCCDFYGNVGGDWVDCIADYYGISGNICEDPLFCDLANDNYYLQECSPCLTGYGCGQIGALGLGCPCGGGNTAGIDGNGEWSSTWGKIKSVFR